MKTLLIRDADVVVTMDDQRRELARAPGVNCWSSRLGPQGTAPWS
jgi:hypothetical protein